MDERGCKMDDKEIIATLTTKIDEMQRDISELSKKQDRYQEKSNESLNKISNDVTAVTSKVDLLIAGKVKTNGNYNSNIDSKGYQDIAKKSNESLGNVATGAIKIMQIVISGAVSAATAYFVAKGGGQ